MAINNLERDTIMIVRYGLVAVLLGSLSLAYAGDVDIPHEFSADDTTSASDINENFSTLETAIDDNDARLDAIESGSTNVVFQGFSVNTVVSDQGIRQLQQACDATFTGSKICTSTEYANSVYNAAAANLQGNAWILADMVNASGSKIRDMITGDTYSNGGLSCGGYSGEEDEALIVNGAGELSLDSCSNANAVACCK